VLPEPVIDPQVASQPAFPLFRVRESHGIGPFFTEGLDEPLGLAVGSGCVGPGADVPQPEDTASYGERFGDVRRPVVAHHPAALDLLAVEPGDSTAEKADHRRLLLVCEHLDVGQSCGVIDSHMDLVVANTSGAALLPIAGDAMTHLPEPGQRLDVDVDQVSRPLAFIPLDRWFGVQIPETGQAQPAEGPGDGRESGVEQPGDVAHVQALVPERNGVLQLLRIERPPLGAANTPSIRQRGHTARAVTSQPAIGAAEADSVLSGQLREAAAFLQMLDHQLESSPLCQACIGVAMHGCVGWGCRVAPQPVEASHLFVS